MFREHLGYDSVYPQTLPLGQHPLKAQHVVQLDKRAASKRHHAFRRAGAGRHPAHHPDHTLQDRPPKQNILANAPEYISHPDKTETAAASWTASLLSLFAEPQNNRTPLLFSNSSKEFNRLRSNFNNALICAPNRPPAACAMLRSPLKAPIQTQKSCHDDNLSIESKDKRTELVAGKTFRHQLAEINAHGILNRAGAPKGNHTWSYDAIEMLDRMDTCAHYLSKFVFEYGMHDSDTEKSYTYGPYTTSQSFCPLAHELAMAYEAIYEIPSRKIRKAIRTHLWLMAVLLYESAGDRPNAQRLGYRLGETYKLYEPPVTITKIIQQSYFDDNTDYREDFLDYARVTNPDDISGYEDGVCELAGAAIAIADFRDIGNLDNGLKAVRLANSALISFILDPDDLHQDEAVIVFTMAASLWLEVIRAQRIGCRWYEDDETSSDDN